MILAISATLFIRCLMLLVAHISLAPSLIKKRSHELLNLFKTLEEEAKTKELKKIQNLFSEENKSKWKKVYYEGNNETCLSSVLFLGTEYLTSNQTKLSKSKTSLRGNT